MNPKLLLYTEDFPNTTGGIRHSGIGRYCHDLALGLAAAGATVTVLAPSDLRHQPFATLALPRFDGRVVARARRVRRALAAGAGHLLIAGDPLAHRVLALGGAPKDVPRGAIFYGTEVLALEPALAYSGISPLGIVRRTAWRRYLDGARPRVCISAYTRSALVRAMQRDAATVVVPPAVAPALLAAPPEPPRRDAAPLTLLLIGRISERKNQLGIVRLVAALRARGIETRCTMLGNVDAPEHEDYRRAVVDLIARERLEDAVTITGHAGDAAKRAHLDACDVLLAVSRTAGSSVEGFGITVLEAAARGRPAIVSTEGGMPETIVEGETGIAVAADDEAGLAAAVTALAQDPARRLAMGEAARRRVEREFTVAAMARRFLDGLL